MAKSKGSAYQPDPFFKTGRSLLGRIMHARETVIYIAVILVLGVIVGAWAVASFRSENINEALNEAAVAREKDEATLESILRKHVSMKEMAPQILLFANEKYLSAMVAEEPAAKTSALAKAEEFFRLLIDNQPSNPLLFLACQGAAYCREESGDKQGALMLFQKALTAAPAEMKDKFCYNVGRLLVALGRRQEAIRYLEDATRGEKIYEQIPVEDYPWRLNARQLLAEAGDENTAPQEAPKPVETTPAPTPSPETTAPPATESAPVPASDTK